MSYSDTLRKHRRLAILRHLVESVEYTSNASILTDVCNGVGVGSSRAQIITEIAWLAENGMVTSTAHGDFVVVTATHSGADIAHGHSSHPDVQRPGPRG